MAGGFAALAVAAVSVVPVSDGADEAEIHLLESTWENATVAIAESNQEQSLVEELTDAQVEVVVEGKVEAAADELVDATNAIGTGWVSTADQDLINALDDVDEALAAVEALVAQPGTASDAALEQANDDLTAAIEVADAKLEVAATTNGQENQLEQADDAINDAAALVTEVVDEDSSWISDLNGWTPNIRYAVDRRGPKRKLTGNGVDIAIIDSGITPVQGLDGADKIINGPDLSVEATVSASNQGLDFYGHGTHLAGIIAGNDGGEPVPGVPHFTGIAPDARLVNVKVADADGSTSMERLIAGIEWVILNKNANGMNIRVLTLAFGYDHDDRFTDPLSAAVEEAWANGIVVVVAGGNQGNGSNGLDAPAISPYVLSVAASDQVVPTDMADDEMTTFSSSGDGVRNPDVAVPGRSIVSLRSPGSNADVNHPESRIGTRFAVASGTSQASAVMAGTVALLLEKDPSLTPDQVKNLFTDTARNIHSGNTLDGEGRVRLNKALFELRTDGPGPATTQTHTRVHPHSGFGHPSANGGGWSGGGWSGGGWSGGGWSGGGWSGGGWSGGGWSGGGWSGGGWSGGGWSGGGWSGGGWSGGGWSGGAWSGGGWS